MSDQTRYLLDTNVVSELRKGAKADENVRAWAAGVPADAQFLSAITVLELELGVLLKRRSDQRQGDVLRQWLDQQVLPAFDGRVLPVDTRVALQCARLHVPDPSSERDALIAATALVHGMTVVTRNNADFRASGVELLNPWEIWETPPALAAVELEEMSLQLAEVILQVTDGDWAGAMKWFREEQLAAFGGKTPQALVRDGRSDDVVAYVRSLSAGPAG